MTRTSRTTPSSQPLVYEIAIQGHLDHDWSEWFDGLSLTQDDRGNTLLRGPISDQAALRGILLRVFDLGLSLLSVNRVRPELQGQTNVSKTNLEKNHLQSAAGFPDL